MSTDVLFSTTSAGHGDTAADTSHGEEQHAGGHHVGPEGLVILFLFGGLGLGGILREVNKKTGIPYTPMLFMIGIGFGYLHERLGLFGQATSTISSIDPHGMLMIFLPTLIFESGFNADWHVFKKQFIQVIILAVPCVFVGALLLAFCIKVILGYSDEYYTWSSAFLFGSVLSCTDTVAVLALLKEVGASKKFSCLIEGESLINDGTCMVLLGIAAELVKGKAMTPAQITGAFLQLSLGGVALGIVFGAISAFWIKKIFNDEVLVVNITFITCYLLYFVCENIDLGIKVSGIIALVSLGLFMAAFGRTRISPESDHAVHTFWRYIVYACETTIFLIAGVLVGIKVVLGEGTPGALPITGLDFVKLFGLYLCMTFARFMAIAIFMPIMKDKGYGMTWDDVFVLTYGGLRGAIGICFAMIIARDDQYPPTLRDFVLFDMSGCAILTLIINGTTAGWVVKWRGLASTSEIKQRVFLGYIENFIQETRDYQEELKNQPYLAAVDWGKVENLIGTSTYEKMIQDGYRRLAQISDQKKALALKIMGPGRLNSPLEQELLEKDENGEYSRSGSENSMYFEEDEAIDNLLTEARDRFIMALKGEYFHLFEISQCGPDAFLLLKESADWDLDQDTKTMSSWDFVSSNFMNPTYIRFLFFLKRFPLFGQFAKNLLFEHLSFVYDVITNYLNAHEAVEALAANFPFNEEVVSSIIKESEENRAMAEGYLNNYLNVSFPEIQKSIQIKKAAFSVLNRQRQFVVETFNQGQIEEKEYKILKKNVDQLTYRLGESQDSWDLPPLKEFLKRLHFFSMFSDTELQDILSDACEKPFQQDDFIYKEGQKAEYIYVLTRGVATETCKETNKTYKEKKIVGSICSYHHLLTGFTRYQTTLMCDSVVYAVAINCEKLKVYSKKHKSIEEYIYRESFYFLSRYYPQELRMFDIVDRLTLNQIVPTFVFKRYKAGAIIDCSTGGVFLRGHVAEYNESDSQKLLTVASTDNPEKSAQSKASNANSHQSVSQAPKEVSFKNLAYIPPKAGFKLRALKPSHFFHFESMELIQHLIEAENAERESKRTLSMARGASMSFKKASMVTHKKFNVAHMRPESEEHRKSSYKKKSAKDSEEPKDSFELPTIHVHVPQLSRAGSKVEHDAKDPITPANRKKKLDEIVENELVSE